MATKQVYDGHALRFFSLRVGPNVLPDTPVRVGNINGYAETDSLGGAAPNRMHSSQAAEFASCATKGAFHVKVEAVTAKASGAQGTPVYFDDSLDGKLTMSSTGGKIWGYVLDDKLVAGTSVVLVAIAQTI